MGMLVRYVCETQEKVMIGAAYHAHRMRRAPLLDQHLSVRFNEDDFIRARVTSVLEPVGSQPVRITVRFEGMGQDGVEQTFDWPDDDVWVISDSLHAPSTTRSLDQQGDSAVHSAAAGN